MFHANVLIDMGQLDSGNPILSTHILDMERASNNSKMVYRAS